MQFAVPQFTDVEDRLIGRLTLKQFLVLLATGGIVMFFWSLFGPTFFFFMFSLPVALVGVGAALGRYNGRPMFVYFMPFMLFAVSPKAMVYKREASVVHLSKAEIKKPKPQKQLTPEELEPAESRLKKLAYFLDQKSSQETEIITKSKFE